MAEAKRDENRVTTLLGVSSIDGTTPVVLWADPATHALLATGAIPGGGTVTDVSVATANGLAGTVATSTSTPVITLSTTVTGLLKGNGTTISAATANTDYLPGASDINLGAFSLTATNVTVSSLTASKPVFSDGLKQLSSSGTVPLNQGGTGQTTKAPAFDALSPMTQAGDIIYGGAAGTGTRLGIGGANTVLHGGASAPSYSAVVEADITLANNTTNNVSTTKHGFTPQLPNLTTQFLRGDGAWAAPASVTIPNAYVSESFAYTANVAHNIVHNFGTYPVVQAFDNSGNMVVPLTIQNTDVNTVAVTFSTSATFTLVLTVGSPPLIAYTTTSGDYSMLAGDYLIEETGASKTITLLTPVGRQGKQVIVKNTSAGICDVVTAAGTIDNVADVTLASFDSLTVISNGTIWLIV